MDKEALIAQTRKRYTLAAGTLDERGRRTLAAAEALAVGWGGITLVARATGLSRATIGLGVKELRGTVAVAAPGRVRRPGGGRKKTVAKDPSVLADPNKVALLTEVRGGGLSGQDHKSALQEYLQSQEEPLPEYRLTGTAGPDHRAEEQTSNEPPDTRPLEPGPETREQTDHRQRTLHGGGAPIARAELLDGQVRTTFNPSWMLHEGHEHSGPREYPGGDGSDHRGDRHAPTPRDVRLALKPSRRHEGCCRQRSDSPRARPASA